jgi:hypothetical protein
MRKVLIISNRLFDLLVTLKIVSKLLQSIFSKYMRVICRIQKSTLRNILSRPRLACCDYINSVNFETVCVVEGVFLVYAI